MASDVESDWSDVEEASDDNVNSQQISCMFCENSLSLIEDCFEHIKEIHNIDIKFKISTLNLDFYGYVKFVNYIRKCKVPPSDIKILSNDDFSSDEFLQPALEGDMMLQFDVDGFLEELETNNQTNNGIDIEKKLSVAEERAKLTTEFLERTLDDLNHCRTHMNSLLLSESDKYLKEKFKVNKDSIGYFSSYEHHGIHEEMLKDATRTKAYQKFIKKNPAIFKGRSVLDVGCGTAILSMFAAQTGAVKIVGVDNSEVAYQAMDIVKENRLENKISIVKGRAEDLSIPEKFDVIISEWMGYFLLFESMLDTVIYCRDHFLTENGRIFPDKCNIKVTAFADQQLYTSKVKYWDDVYGFKMSTLKSSVLEEPLIEIVDHTHFISEAVVVKEFDLMLISVLDLDFDEKFELKIIQDGLCSSIVGSFDIFFGGEGDEMPVTFSTGAECVPTHWKQTIFLLKEPFMCKAGETVDGRIFCKKNKKDYRALDIALIFYDNKANVKLRQHYVIS